MEIRVGNRSPEPEARANKTIPEWKQNALRKLLKGG